MAETYGTTTIPSDSVTVRSGGTVSIGAAFETTLGLVGGMDTANGNATTGDVITVESTSDAEQQFGENSELAKNVAAAYANGAGTIYAVGVAETQTTETFSTSSSGTLGNTPVFDPNVQPEHEITATDTVEAAEMTVSIVYGSPSQPADANTINLNPVTGEWSADESSDYDIDYAYGDYGSAITDVVKKVPRIVSVLTESTTVANSLLSELNTYDTDFDFMHGIVGAPPESSASSYTDSVDDRRLSIVAPSRAWLDEAETDQARTAGAVGGRASGKALGDSLTYETLLGFASLNTQYTNSELGTLIDNQVMPLRQSGGISIVKDMTTSTDVRFERLYASEIIDEATEISHGISQQFVGDANTENNRTLLRESHTTSYNELREDGLLEDFIVSVSKGANDFEVDVDIGLDVIGIIDTVDVTITVGDVVQNGGAA